MATNITASAAMTLLNIFSSATLLSTQGSGKLPEIAKSVAPFLQDTLRWFRHQYDIALGIATALVGIGVILEGFEVVHEYREKAGPFKIHRPEAPIWMIRAAFWGWLMVSVGVAGEFVFESWVSTKNQELESVSNALLGDAQLSAAEANKRAGYAASSAISAAAAADRANKSADSVARKAETLNRQLRSQQRRGDILMDPKLRDKFISPLMRFSGQYFDVSSCGIRESEIGYFSMAIWGTLLGKPRWNIGNLDDNSPSCPPGLLVLTDPGSSTSTKQAAKALLGAFIDVGLAPKNSRVGNIGPPPPEAGKPGTWFLHASRPDAVVIVVGTHP